MRCSMMFVAAVCVMFLMKLRWPKKKSIYSKSDRVSPFPHQNLVWSGDISLHKILENTCLETPLSEF